MKKLTNRQNCLHMWTWLATQKKGEIVDKIDYFTAFPQKILFYSTVYLGNACGACEEITRINHLCFACPVQWSNLTIQADESCHNSSDSPYYLWRDSRTAENAQKVLNRIKETWLIDKQL